MELLRYRSQAYSKHPQQISTIASENVACYRGQRYNLPEPVTICQTRSPLSLISAVVCKYRGVSYVDERHQFPKQNKTLVHH